MEQSPCWESNTHSAS